MNDFESYLKHTLDDVADSQVKEAMLYSLMAGGKRVRPQLLFSALKAYNCEDVKLGYPAAAAIEMIHTYSLIHDDLPAMDNDTLRRGKPTCHVQFNEGIAILAGDGLLTHAFSTIATASDRVDVVRNMVVTLSQYSGANGMILGQIKDLEGEANPNISVEGLEDIHFYKTGKLLTLPLLFAAYLMHKEEHIPAWETIGKYLGLSFQIQDDILDVTSTKEELGKNINSDAANQKQTYVTLMGVARAQEEANRYYQMAWDTLETLPVKAMEMKPLFDLLMKRNH